MPVSSPTVLRELRRAGCLPPPDPVVIGIDDWALARSHRYGTIVVDLERHCPIELLAGRDAPTVVSWLLAPTEFWFFVSACDANQVCHMPRSAG